MTFRKWLVRGFLLVLMLMLGGAYYVYGQYTNPEAVAQMVLAELKQHFPDASIQLGHAQWRLFGGILLTDLKVTPKDHPSEEPTAVLRQTTLKIDKAQAAQGKFELLRVQLDQPMLNLERDEAGRWNVLSLLTAKPKASGSIPFVVLNKGTIRFHDRRLDFPVLELTGVDAKLTPQPQGNLMGEGQGHSALLGNIEFRFTHDPVKDSTELNFLIPNIDYQPKLEEIIVKLIPIWKEQQLRVRGKIGIESKLTWYPHQDIPLIESHVRLHSGELRHPKLPVPLKDIQADLQYHPDALHISHFSAKAEKGTIQGNGKVELGTDIRNYQEHRATLHVEYDNIHLHKGVYPSLPPILRKFCEDMKTEGLLNGTLDLHYRDQTLGLAYTLKPHHASFEADDFPYPANSIAGVLQYREEGEHPTLTVDLHGQFGTRPFQLKGLLFGNGLRPDNSLRPGLDLQIHAESLSLDEQLYRALEPYPETHRVIKQFHASGELDCDLRLHRLPGVTADDKPATKRWVSASLRDVAFRFDPFPCPIEKASGKLEIFPNKQWSISQLEGEHRGAKVTGQAWMVGTAAGDVLHIDLVAQKLGFTNELHDALPPEVQSVWKHFKPTGHVDCKVTFDKLEKGKPNVEVTVAARGGSILPGFFPYALHNLQGNFHFANKEVKVGPLTAEHGSTAITIDGGHVTIRPEAGFLVQMHGINFDQVPVDDDLLKALPAMMREAVATLKPSKPLKLRVNLDVDDPGADKPAKISWNGSAEINDCDLHVGVAVKDATGIVLMENGVYDQGKLDCQGQLFVRSMNIMGKQVVGPFHSKLLMTKDVLQLPECKLSIPGGGVQGLIQVMFGGGGPRYHLNLDADFRIEEFLQQPKELKGRTRAAIRLNGEGSKLDKLSGEGTILVEQGAHLVNLPLVIDIFNQFSQMLPKATNFQTAKVDFVVQGDRFRANQVQLLGDAYRVEGTGTTKLDGSDLDLTLSLVMGGGRTLPLMPAMLDTLQKTIAKGLMKVHVTGSVSKVEVSVEPVPFLVEPVKEMFKSTGKK
ncbi:MAG: AsmA-like C-terminal region-containing protein [Gemmatales bacterium]